MTKITWLGHGTVQFQFSSGEVLVVDPWLENPKYPKGHTIDRVDAIAVSHGHFDHVHDVDSAREEALIERGGNLRDRELAGIERRRPGDQYEQGRHGRPWVRETHHDACRS